MPVAKKKALWMVSRLTQRAPDGWDSPRFQAVCMAWSWFRQSGVVSSHPPAGNAHRWGADQVQQKAEQNT